MCSTTSRQNRGACEGRRPITADARARLCTRETSRRNIGTREGRQPANADARARLCTRETSRRNHGARKRRRPVNAHARLGACDASLQNYKPTRRCRQFSSVCMYADYVDHAAEQRTQRAAGTRRSEDLVIQDASSRTRRWRYTYTSDKEVYNSAFRGALAKPITSLSSVTLSKHPSCSPGRSRYEKMAGFPTMLLSSSCRT